jgi:hypothetical protein
MPQHICRAKGMELRVITNPIDQAGPARRLLSNLFYGWGYNFYRREDDLQADDLLIRAKLSQLLCDSRTRVLSLHAAFVRRLLPPDRGGARANPGIVDMERALESAERELQTLEMAVVSAAAPEPGRIRRRDPEQLATLAKLVALDGETLLALVTLRDAIARFEDGAAAALGIDGLLRASDFGALWSRRQAMLASACR